MSAARVTGAIVRTDLRRELRRPLGLVGMLLFGACSLVVLHLALAGGARPTPETSAGAIWIVLLYGALLGVARCLDGEREEGTWDGLLLAAADRSALFAGKVASALLHVALLHLGLVPLYLLLFGAPPTGVGIAVLAAAVLLADLGLAACGVLVGAISLRARSRELLAACMLLPLAIPLLVAAVTATLWAFAAAPGANVVHLLGFLALFDATFVAIGVAAFPEVAVE